MNTGTPEYLQKTVTSTRIRLARNVRGYYFPHLLSDENAREIVGLVRRALKKLDNFREYDIGRISRDDAERDRRRAFRGAAVCVRRKAGVSDGLPEQFGNGAAGFGDDVFARTFERRRD